MSCLYKNFKLTIKITSFERFSVKKFLFRFCKTFIVFVYKFFKIFCLFSSLRIKLLVCACVIKMLHYQNFAMFSRKNYCCTPLICRFYDYSSTINPFMHQVCLAILMHFENSGCSVLERLFSEYVSIPSRSKLLRMSI